jgi:hypothetical protein
MGRHRAVEGVNFETSAQPTAQMVVGAPVAESQFEHKTGDNFCACPIEPSALGLQAANGAVEPAQC